MSASQKKINFHFVTGNPRTDSEKRTVRTIVRSNASNRRWRLVRETAAKSKADGQISVESSLSPESTEEPVSQRPSAEPEDEDKISKQRRLASRDARRLSRAEGQEHQVALASPLKSTNLAQCFLGTDMPGTDVSMQSLNRALRGTAFSYAQLLPSGKNRGVSQMAKDWFLQCLNNRGILHTALFCQTRRAEAIQPGTFTMSGNELMLCQTEAVHAINNKLSQHNTAVDDESLRIVLSLMWHGPVKQKTGLHSPRQVPLTSLQAIRMFLGLVACDTVHAQGLDRMLALRGSLSSVKTPGLAHLISYGDILAASTGMQRPAYEYASYAEHVLDARIDDDWLNSTSRFDHPLISLGNGFQILHVWISYERAASLKLVLSGMADYIRASHDFIEQSPAERNSAVMTDQRNMIQHRLMSLCPDLQAKPEKLDLFDVIWLAAFAYSMIAVFPLSPNAAHFDRIGRLLKSRLCDPLSVTQWARAPNLTLWIIVVGALSAIGSEDRAWYVDALRQERCRLGLANWPTLKIRLMEFLWLPMVSDADGSELWEEVEQTGHVLL